METVTNIFFTSIDPLIAKLLALGILSIWVSFHLWHKIIKKMKIVRRYAVKKEINQLLIQNHTLLEKYGPFQYYTEQKDKMWSNTCQTVIIPNNEKIIAILDNNLDLISEYNLTKVAIFKAHCKGFKENRNNGNNANAEYPRFSETGINNIFN